MNSCWNLKVCSAFEAELSDDTAAAGQPHEGKRRPLPTFRRWRASNGLSPKLVTLGSLLAACYGVEAAWVSDLFADGPGAARLLSSE
jgi:hypothetical protein